jgi:hypothetical protein
MPLVQVVPSTAGFMDAWDGDNSLVYDPDTTAAIILSEQHPVQVSAILLYSSCFMILTAACEYSAFGLL